MGRGTASPCRIRCNRSNWLMARYICRCSVVSHLMILSRTSGDGSMAAVWRAASYRIGQPPCFLMVASISPIKRLVSINAQTIRGYSSCSA